MMWQKFFQIRQMTKSLDDAFDADAIILNRLLNAKSAIRNNRIESEKHLLVQWDHYRQANMKRIIQGALSSSPPFKLCICDFIDGRRISLELWFKIMHDVFNDDVDGKTIRYKFWTYLKKRSRQLKTDLLNRQWPMEWDYLEREPCLCLEILKLFEHYIPIRVFMALNINQIAPNSFSFDLRRMPILIDNKSLVIDQSMNTWFPRLNICRPLILEQLMESNNIFCHHILHYAVMLNQILQPVLMLFDDKKDTGRVINIYGKYSEFLYEVFYSMKQLCGQALRTTSSSLRVAKVYKGSTTAYEEQCQIVVATMHQLDIDDSVMLDIRKNFEQGHQIFRQGQNERGEHCRLIILLSDRKLKISNLGDSILYHAFQDQLLTQLFTEIDYKFLVYYANILFNKPMVVQQNGGSRKPFYQLMLVMWTYVLPLLFKDKNESLSQHNIFVKLQNFNLNPHIELDSDSDVILLEGQH